MANLKGDLAELRAELAGEIGACADQLHAEHPCRRRRRYGEHRLSRLRAKSAGTVAKSIFIEFTDMTAHDAKTEVPVTRNWRS